MSKKSFLAKVIACMLVLVMVLCACGPQGSSASDPGTPASQPGGEENPPAGGDAKTTRFEAEYATITGNVPGLMGVFYGASNNCMLEPMEKASNGYAVTNCYVEGNEDNPPSITFTITSDAEAEATIILGVGCAWHMDESFNTVFDDTDVNTAYPVTVNGEAVTTDAKISAADVQVETTDDGIIKIGNEITGANYGTVTLKAGENTITITSTAQSQNIDYLELVTTANVTMEEDHTHTYRTYSEDDFEYIEVAV